MPRSKYLKQPLLSMILSIWEGKESKGLRFMEIHNALVEKGIIENKNSKMTTNRILKDLIKYKYIEKRRDGKYYLIKDEPEYKTLGYINELYKKCKFIDLDMDFIRLTIGFNLSKYTQEDMEKVRKAIRDWARWTYYCLIKSPHLDCLQVLKEVAADAPETKAPESLYFILGLMVGAYQALLARFYQFEEGAIILTPAPEIVDEDEFIKKYSLDLAKGPYTLAFALANLEPEKAEIWFERPWFKERFGKEVVEEARKLYPYMRLSYEISRAILYLSGESTLRVPHEINKLISIAKNDPYKLGLAIGIHGYMGYKWLLDFLRDQEIDINNEWLEKFEKGFKEGRNIHRKIQEEESESYERQKQVVCSLRGHIASGEKEIDDVKKLIKTLLSIAKEFNLPPIVAARDFYDAHLTLALYEFEKTYFKQGSKYGFSEQWLIETREYTMLMELSDVLLHIYYSLQKMNQLREEDYEKLIKRIELIKERFDWRYAAKSLGFDGERYHVFIEEDITPELAIKIIRKLWPEASEKDIIEHFEKGKELRKKALEKYGGM